MMWPGRSSGPVKDAAVGRPSVRCSSDSPCGATSRTSGTAFLSGSVLLLAAIGLAITFGVMGVINMAHGEMVMLGAYATYVTQQMIRRLCAGPVGSLPADRPACRVRRDRQSPASSSSARSSASCTVVPLETLLATYGVSLILQQLVRSIFGANNKERGHAGLHVRHVPGRRPRGHLWPAVDRRVLAGRVLCAAGASSPHAVRPCVSAR